MDNKQFDNEGNEILQSEQEQELTPNQESPQYTAPPTRRRLKWNRIAIVAILAVVAILAIGNFISHRGSLGTTVVNVREDISFIHIDASSARVVVETLPRGRDEVQVQLVNFQESALVVKNGNLIVDTRLAERNNRRLHFGILQFGDIGRREVRIYLPANMELSAFTASSRAGSVRVDGVSAETFAAASTSGSVRLQNINAEELSATSTGGSVRLYNVNTNDLTARSTSGSVRGEDIEFTNGYLRSTSGSVRFTGATWQNLEARSTSGSVRFTDARITPLQGSTYLQSTSGSTRLYLRNSRNDFTYQASASSGTIRIDGQNHGRGNTSGGNGQHQLTLRSTSGSSRMYFNR
ncbi:MAG: DUF4097 domain-containing protein [Defluviitaleaceae bacterium]|nr:DUF4097 domain-containing protein [Defluviitaleaceae bacterium]